MAITFKMQQDKDMCITTVYCKTIFAVVKMLQKIGEKLNETWCWPVQESYETWDSILHNIVDQINYVVFNRMKHFLVLVGIGVQTPREIIWFFFSLYISDMRGHSVWRGPAFAGLNWNLKISVRWLACIFRPDSNLFFALVLTIRLF